MRRRAAQAPARRQGGMSLPLVTPADIIRLLQQAGVAYRHLQHAPTRTSDESAAARGEPLEIGAKALLLKLDRDFRLFVLSAASRLDSPAIKQRFGVKSVRFATPEELLALTGLVPGSVPPFGRPLLDFELYCDVRIAGLARVAFNAGSLTESIVMGSGDYLRVAQPTDQFRFAQASASA